MDQLQVTQVSTGTSTAAQYLPEPATTTGSTFSSFLDAAKSATSTALSTASSYVTGDFAELLQMQIQAQEEMQAVSMVSNIEKSKHESRMAAVRNIRVG